MFTEPHLNTRGGGRILHSYANPLLRLGFAYNYREYINKEKVLRCFYDISQKQLNK